MFIYVYPHFWLIHMDRMDPGALREGYPPLRFPQVFVGTWRNSSSVFRETEMGSSIG
jgi:hypothetical protein